MNNVTYFPDFSWGLNDEENSITFESAIRVQYRKKWYDVYIRSKYESDEFRFHTKTYGKPSSGCLNFSNRASTAAAKGPMKPTKGNICLPCGYPK